MTTICEICGRSFSTKGNLCQHVRQVHNKERNYKCEDCGKTFSRGNELKKHYVVHEPNPPTKRKFKGEKAVEEVLGDKEVGYIREKKFDGLVGLSGGSLRYDFAIPVHQKEGMNMMVNSISDPSDGRRK